MKSKITYTAFLLLCCSLVSGQMQQYRYKRELSGIKGQWHSVSLPNEVFGKVAQNLSDIRIFGITKNKDTIEVPYLLKTGAEKTTIKTAAFQVLNASKNSNGYYYTLEVPNREPINQMKLEFGEADFDWRLKLEGSEDQKQWFTLSEDYRILSIKNAFTDFKFTEVNFPMSAYRYFRISVNSEKYPKLQSAKLSATEKRAGNFTDYPHSIITKQDKPNKQTIISVKLQTAVPVSSLEFFISNNKIDYYREAIIEYVSDSIKTEQGWKYNYRELASGTLNSIEKNDLHFAGTILQQLRITVANQDNQPLHIDSLAIKGTVHKLAARFAEPAVYYLVYGNTQASPPQYDIARFPDKIPTVLSSLNMGEERLIEKELRQTTLPLFQNKMWLWAIIIVIIALLGWFTLRMIRQK